MMKCENGYGESKGANNKNTGCVRLGVHIRRGDYDTFKGGVYYYDNSTYANNIKWFCSLHPEAKMIHVYISTNDPSVSVASFQELCGDSPISIHLLGGNQAEDLCLLSKCDYLIGPPSTFSLVAAMYHDIPLYRMDTADPSNQTPESFKKFDYWFRRII